MGCCTMMGIKSELSTFYALLDSDPTINNVTTNTF